MRLQKPEEDDGSGVAMHGSYTNAQLLIYDYYYYTLMVLVLCSCFLLSPAAVAVTGERGDELHLIGESCFIH